MRISDWSSDVCSSDLSQRPDYWGFARSLYAAGFRPGDLVYNCFSYHFTPAGSMMETAAHVLGCTVFPGGIGQTEQQARTMADLAPSGYTGTPSFLNIILEKADERSEEHTSELQSLMRSSYAVFCLKKKTIDNNK